MMRAATRAVRDKLPYVLLVVVSVTVYHVRGADLQRQVTHNRALAATACDVSIRDWNAWQKVIATTQNPPSLRGRSISQSQRDALDAYAAELSDDVGPKPDCVGSAT